MSWSEHWSVLLSGAVGSLISLIGVFGVFWATTRYDRRRDQAESAAAKESAYAAGMSAAIARIRRVIIMQGKDLTWAPVYGHAQVLELVSACMDFTSLAVHRHPGLAAWVMQQNGLILEARSAYWRRMMFLGFRRRSRDLWAAEMSTLLVALFDWERGERHDQWFAEHLSS